MTAILTVCFDRVIRVICEHGGDVMKFAGEALLALWKVPGDDLDNATARAAQCALAVRGRCTTMK